MRRELEAAFRNTRYRVFAGSGDLLLWVDQPAPVLPHLLRAAHAHCAALLTAFNPGGQRHPRFRNFRSQMRLRAELARLGYRMLEGCNEDPRGRWPVEPSLLVLGLPLPAARKVAARYGQAAFLWMGTEGVPRLMGTAATTGASARQPTPRRCFLTRPVA